VPVQGCPLPLPLPSGTIIHYFIAILLLAFSFGLNGQSSDQYLQKNIKILVGVVTHVCDKEYQDEFTEKSVFQKF